MFKKKNKKQIKEKKINLDIQTIPDVFYGGKNPVIYKTEKQKQISNTQVNKIKSKFSKKQKIIFISIFLFIIFSLVSVYVVYDYFQNNLKTNINTIAEKQDSSEEKIEEIKEPEENSKIEEIVEETKEPEEDPKTEDEFLFLNFPPLLLSNSADTDSDELTDLEESVFGLDTGAWDTDLDTYHDGQEVVNLYNPKGFAPVKIIDSGLVSEYISPVFNYRLYYPQTWEKGEVDQEFKQVIFSSDTGDYISVNVFEKKIGQDFYDWFSKNAKDQKANDLIAFVNRFKNKAMVRRDGLVYYFENDKFMIVLVYNPRDIGPIKYRHIFEMIAQSFRFSALDVEDEFAQGEPVSDGENKQNELQENEINTSTSSTIINNIENNILTNTIDGENNEFSEDTFI